MEKTQSLAVPRQGCFESCLVKAVGTGLKGNKVQLQILVSLSGWHWGLGLCLCLRLCLAEPARLT